MLQLTQFCSSDVRASARPSRAHRWRGGYGAARAGLRGGASRHVWVRMGGASGVRLHVRGACGPAGKDASRARRRGRGECARPPAALQASGGVRWPAAGRAWRYAAARVALLDTDAGARGCARDAGAREAQAGMQMLL